LTPDVQAILKARKPELLAVLSGDYLCAALALVLSVPDLDQREELAHRFDERAGICEYDGGRLLGMTIVAATKPQDNKTDKGR
jgi:hypothetical protein